MRKPLLFIAFFFLLFSVSTVSGLINATGGTITDSGRYRYHVFTSSGTFNVTNGTGNIEVLIVAGGGGGGTGGTASRGGGGSGGLIHNSSFSVTEQAYTVAVGGGGAAGGGDGSNSSFSTLVAKGGGGGGPGHLNAGRAGGSGGGGSGWNDVAGGAGQQPGLASGGYGNAGGQARTGTSNGASGGGGGAGAVGVKGTSVTGGAGGAGLEYTQFAIVGGSPAGWFAGGGGGGGSTGVTSAGAGGTGGGGAGGRSAVGTGGTANTGGGGGGSTTTGGVGGSGVVIIRYLVVESCPISYSGSFSSTTGVINTSFYDVGMNYGVIDYLIYHALNETADWTRTNSESSGSNLGEIFSGDWRMGGSLSSTTCLVDDSSCDYVKVTCQNANGAKNNWTFRETYIELDSVYGSDYRVYHYGGYIGTGVIYDGAGTNYTGVNAWSTHTFTDGISGYNSQGMNQVMGVLWDETVKTSADRYISDTDYWVAMAVGRASQITAGTWMKSYYKVLDTTGQDANDVLSAFKEELSYGDPITEWSKCKEITINNPGSTTLTDFTTPLNISYDSDMQADFDDLRFYIGGCDWNESATALYAELEYKVNGGNAYAWVKNTLSVGNNIIAMYYGNPSATNTWDDSGNAWNSNYDAVWHFTNQSGGVVNTIYDSTSNNYDGVTNASPYTMTNAAFGLSTYFHGTAHANFGDILDFQAGQDFSIEMLVYTNSTAFGAWYFSKYVDASNRWYLRLRASDGEGDSYQLFGALSSPSSAFNARSDMDNPPQAGVWEHVVINCDRGSEADFYIDGNFRRDDTYYTCGGSTWDFGDLLLGKYTTYYGRFLIDEARFYSGLMSADLINMSYKTLLNSSSVITFGDEEEQTVEEEEPDSCVCELTGGGNLAINLSHNCVMVDDCNLGTGAITFSGSGSFSINSTLYNVTEVIGLNDGDIIWILSNGLLWMI